MQNVCRSYRGCRWHLHHPAAGGTASGNAGADKFRDKPGKIRLPGIKRGSVFIKNSYLNSLKR